MGSNYEDNSEMDLYQLVLKLQSLFINEFRKGYCKGFKSGIINRTEKEKAKLAYEVMEWLDKGDYTKPPPGSVYSEDSHPSE